MIKVSLVLAAYNSDRYLDKAIKSILGQTFKDFEFLIVDDASRDNSLEIIKKYLRKDKRIKLLRNKKRLGLTKSLNKAIKAVKGDYIARMDADDIARPERLKAQVEFMETHPKIAVLGSWVRLIDSRGKKLKIIKTPVKPDEIKKLVLASNPFVHPTLVFRHSVLKKVGFYNKNFRYAQDYELILRILKKHQGKNINKVLLLYRVADPKSISIKNLKEQERYALKARLQAIFKIGYSPLYFIFLIKPLLSYLVPARLKYFIYKKFFWGI